MNLEKIYEDGPSYFIGNNSFENPSMEMLVVDEDNILEALAMQAPGIAFFGALYKDAERNYKELEHLYSIRYNEIFADCSDYVTRTKVKSTQKDVDAHARVKYKDELEAFEKKLREAERTRDLTKSFYDGWVAKGYSMGNIISLIQNGIISLNDSIKESNEKATSFKDFMNRTKRGNFKND